MSTITIKRASVDGTQEEKEIRELSEEECAQHDLLGKAVGINFSACLTLGAKHKEWFWERVCGYRILEDDKDAKLLSETIKKASGKDEEYIAVNFYERRAKEEISFVPRRLEIPGRPELSNFPFNILFGSFRAGGKGALALDTAEYIPDISSFREEGAEQKMNYYNKHGGEHRWRVEIVYNTQSGWYSGTKYCDNNFAGSAIGKHWEGFFMHLTMLGVGNVPDTEA